MNLSTLYGFKEERKKKKRVGRGSGSGWGCTSGKGHKGQNARSGGGVRPGFEGGQMPLQRRLPKHGFTNKPFKKSYTVINLGILAKIFEGKEEIFLADMHEKGICSTGSRIKILGSGEISTGLRIEAHKFSRSTEEKVLAAGGSIKKVEG